MAYSNNQRYQIKKNKYRAIGNCIGQGGNGIVFDAKCTGEKYDIPIVIKILKNKYKKDAKRRSRFQNEIRTVLDIQDNIEGVMKILDYKCSNKENFYIMEKAIPCFEFLHENDVNFSDKIKILIRIAKTISELHTRGKYHRDIKPGNILFVDNNAFLSDFGLEFSDGGERNTTGNEAIGPYLIRPPEFEKGVNILTEFSKSDVYLFAKTAWMVIKNNNMGFYGKYEENKWCFLNKYDYSVNTLEPLHKMLEGATKNSIDDRITIDKCIELLELQLKISTVPCEIHENLIFEEIIRKHYISSIPDEVAFSKYETVNQILEDMKKHIEFDIIYEENKFIFKFDNFNIIDLKEKVYSIVDETGRNLLLKIDNITMTDQSMLVKTLKMDKQDEYQSFKIANRRTFYGIIKKLAIYDEYTIICKSIK